jgi:nitrite reductase/ring-hydroxylating ferredoxin subunit/CDGSH-type Zn-finger protein
MDKPIIAATSPIAVELEAGRDYFYCTCGRSNKQPFCDGSHQGTEFKPFKFNSEESGERLLCRCKQTGNPPYCDGSHNKVSEELTQVKPEAGLRWYKVAEIGEINDGESRVVNAGSHQLALTFLGGNYGAIDNRCPHQGGPLGEGTLGENQCLHCPWHGWSFNAFTGEGTEGEGGAVAAYPVQQRDKGV